MTDPKGDALSVHACEDRTFVDAIRNIADLTQPPFLTPPSEPDGHYWIRNADGGYERATANPAPRSYSAETVPGLVSLIRLYAETSRVDVFVGSSRVVAVCDEAGEHKHVSDLSLIETDPFNCLLGDGLVGIGQQELVLKLSTTFRDQIEPADFLPLARNLRWKNNEDGTAKVRHDGGSYGMDVEMAVAGLEKDEKIPETIVLTPAVYTNAIRPSEQLRATIKCAVTANPAQKQFSIKPLPDQLELAREHACSGIADFIEKQFQDANAPAGKVVVHRDAVA